MHFAYNASALGAGGVIERGPVTYTIPSLASVALAPTGGEGRSVVSNYVSEELSFSHAETRVFGRQTGGDRVNPLFTTSTYVLLRDVNIFDRVTIRAMGSTVTSTRGFEGGDDHPFELSIFFEDVRIDGRPVRPKIDLQLASLSRYEDFARALAAPATRAADTRQLAARFNATPEQLARLVKERKPVQGCLVTEVEGLVPAPKGAAIPVPGLGVVRFGELMLKPGRRRLNLLRFTFGPNALGEGAMPMALRTEEGLFDEGSGPSTTGGSMTLGSGERNGTPIEP